MDTLNDLWRGTGREESILEATFKSLARTMGSTLGREIIRGVLGGIKRGPSTSNLVDETEGADSKKQPRGK
jgi:hypothetical protein